MLVPATIKKEELQAKMAKKYYTRDMFMWLGERGNYNLNIKDECEPGQYQYASVNANGEAMGYISFYIDYYEHNCYQFGLIGFGDGHDITLARDLDRLMEQLLTCYNLHRIEFRAVADNPVCRTYDRFCKAHGGKCFTLTDCIRDEFGQYHSLNIYEILLK